MSKSPCVVVEFDESLNKTTQECQMDIVVRFWDTECQRVKTRYWDSRFMGHSAHQDLLLHFNDSIASINSARILQVSMDVPTVNHKFYSKLVEQRKEISSPGMIDIGSCGLHIIHGTFKTGLEATGWALKSILKGAHTVLHDTPAHRANYLTFTGSDQYPLFFCEARWVEDTKPARGFYQCGQTCRNYSSFGFPCQKDSNQVGRALKLFDWQLRTP